MSTQNNNTDQNPKLKTKLKRNSEKFFDEQIKKLKEKKRIAKQKEKTLLRKNKQANETAFAFSFFRFFFKKYMLAGNYTAQYILNNSFADPDFMFDFLLNNKKQNSIWDNFMNSLAKEDLKKFGLYNAFHKLKYNEQAKMFEKV